jgi:ABC-2 type transport system permease protein
MSEDLRTMFWKEWRSLVGGKARRQVLLTGGMLSIWAVWFPIQMGGEDFVSDPLLMGIITITMPMIITGIIVPDAIAGERERHTLGTLLASRLPDRAILYGKLAFGVMLGWFATPLLMLVGLVVANLVALDAAPLFYDPVVLVVVLALGLLVALLTGSIGVFVSLRAATAQEAQQLTLIGLMVPFMVAGFGAMLVFSDRALAQQAIDFMGSPEAWLIVIAIMAVLLVIDGLLVVAADRRFRRGRLIARGI